MTLTNTRVASVAQQNTSSASELVRTGQKAVPGVAHYSSDVVYQERVLRRARALSNDGFTDEQIEDIRQKVEDLDVVVYKPRSDSSVAVIGNEAIALHRECGKLVVVSLEGGLVFFGKVDHITGRAERVAPSLPDGAQVEAVKKVLRVGDLENAPANLDGDSNSALVEMFFSGNCFGSK